MATYKAVILIGGPQKGTRFRPLSLETPKPLFPVAGFPIVQHHIEKLLEVDGLKEILLIGFYQQSEIGPFVNEIQSHSKIHIRYLQEFTTLGTAGGIFHFRDQIRVGNPTGIFVINADVCGDLPFKELAQFQHTLDLPATCIILTTEVLHYVEKPTTFVSAMINCGVYLITEDMFTLLGNAFRERAQCLLEDHSDSFETPETLWFERDIFRKMASTQSFYAFHTNRWWSQIKTAAAAIYANRHCLKLYHEGHPDRLTKPTECGPEIHGDVYIHPTADIDSTAVIGPNVSVGKHVVVGAGVRIRESIVLEGAILQDHCCVLFSVIGWKSVVGMWSRVEGTPIGPNPNMPFAKLENKPLFKNDGRLNPAITILGCNVQIPRETIVLNSIVLPHKELSGSYKNQIIL